MDFTTEYPPFVPSDTSDEFLGTNDSSSIALMQDSNKSVAEEAADYLIYKIGFGLHIYFLPILVLVGLVGNTLSFIIMVKPTNRRLSCCVYMAVLAVSDNVALFIMGYYWTKPTFEIPIFHQLECSILGYILIGSAQYGMLIIVAMTVDRFMVVRFSLSSARLSHCTAGRARVMAGVLLGVALVFNIPHLVLLDTGVNYTCITFSGSSALVRAYALLSIILNAFVPFIALLTMNIIIIKTIKDARKSFDEGGSFLRSRGPQTSGKDQSVKEQAQLTVMLLLVNGVFLLLTMPVYVRYIIYTIVNYRTHPAVLATYILVYHITHKLYYTNNAVNFFLYCIGGSKFRKELKQLFVKIKGSVTNSDKTTSTASSSV